ncbi:MAG: hypothetical protein WCO57_13975 [Verrucomicrobiota bacterium]
MKFIIFICNRIRHGQYPRLPEFFYNEEVGKYVYQGRELTLEEFNAAALVVFDPNYRSNGYNFCPMAIESVEIPAADDKLEDTPPADIPTANEVTGDTPPDEVPQDFLAKTDDATAPAADAPPVKVFRKSKPATSPDQ